MNNRERLESLEKIDDIMRDVCQLQVSTSELGNSDTEEKLVDIWQTTQAIQRTLCNREVVTCYRQDALAQAARVCDLIIEGGPDPDERQLASIGYASDVLAERIKEYRKVVQLQQRIEALPTEAAMEG